MQNDEEIESFSFEELDRDICKDAEFVDQIETPPNQHEVTYNFSCYIPLN
jgi:hypothetical protein